MRAGVLFATGYVVNRYPETRQIVKDFELPMDEVSPDLQFRLRTFFFQVQSRKAYFCFAEGGN